jgi:multicomponent Na+:H+ antiporter subunit D
MVFKQPGAAFALDVILILSGFTMLLGVMGAMCQWEIRRILSWHIISQVGYMLMGIGMAGIVIAGDSELTEAVKVMAISGTIFYIVHHIIVKSCLFLCGGIAERVTGTQKLKEMGGAIDLAPGVAGLFLVAAFSLAGMPPFSGFLAKFVLIRAGLNGGAYFIVFISIITSFLTLYSMSKIWSYAFWRKKGREKAGPNYRAMMLPTSVLVLFTIILGTWAQPFVSLGNRAAHELMYPLEEGGYVPTVMNIKEAPRDLEHEDTHADHASIPDGSSKLSGHVASPEIETDP